MAAHKEGSPTKLIKQECFDVLWEVWYQKILSQDLQHETKAYLQSNNSKLFMNTPFLGVMPYLFDCLFGLAHVFHWAYY